VQINFSLIFIKDSFRLKNQFNNYLINYIMKKLFLFVVLALTSSVFLKTQAQTWSAPSPVGVTFASGTGYYVYNVGEKSFMDRGGDWGTRAALGSGSLITPVQSTTLWILQYESSSRTLFRDSKTGGSTYTDNNWDNTWDIQLSDAVNNIYTIQCPTDYASYNANEYFGASATTYSSGNGVIYDLRYNRAASDYTKWKFCTADAVAKYNAQVQLDKYMKIAKLVGSNIDLTSYINTYNTGAIADIITATTNLKTALNPTDKTSSIVNPTFASSPATGWTTTNANYGYNATNLEVEYWQKTFDFNQALTGLPAGVYVVKVQGYERPAGASTAAHTAYTNGWDALDSKFYATASSATTFQPLKSSFAETTCTVGGNVDGLLFPNSMTDAQTNFAAGLYDNELDFVTVDATGTLTLGISNSYGGGSGPGEWIIFDNFRLYYYGALVIPNISVSQTSLFYSSAITKTKTFDVTGANLTGDITITAPTGIILTGTNLVNNGAGSYTIAKANAQSTTTITATWDGSANLTDNISVASNSVTTLDISVATSKDKECFTPLYTTLTNIITDPYCNSLESYAGWGNQSVVTDYVYCGARSIKFTGKCGASIDYNLTGKISGSKTYRVKAMVSTNGTGEAKLAITGATANEIINTITTAAGEWLPIDFTFTTDPTVTTSPDMFFNSCETQTATEGYIDNWEMYDITSVFTGVNNPSSNTLSQKVYIQNNKIVSEFNLVDASKVEFSVFNAQGMLLSNTKSNFDSGKNHYIIDANLPSGMYIVRIAVNGKYGNTKVVL
jgi:hypothetical protein